MPAAPSGYPAQAVAVAPHTDGLAIGALISGILALVCTVACLGLILGPAALIMGFISRSRIASSGGRLTGGGLAIAGVILGILGFIGSASWALFFFFANRTSSSGG